jgi:enediyne biosynthesis protein E4
LSAVALPEAVRRPVWRTVNRVALTVVVVWSATNVFGHDPVVFRDVAAERGLMFTHVSPFTPERHIHLTMGSGLAWLDYDGDGSSDLYLAQGCVWSGTRTPHPENPTDRLFRNRGGRFMELKSIGLENRAYGMGVAVGDYDNDGFPDLFVSNFGPNRLFHNNGDGTFSVDTANAILQHDGYGASCTWFDADADGHLDLFVTNYAEIDDRNYLLCREPGPTGLVPLACQPWKYPGAQDRFYRNDGAGGFTDETERAGFLLSSPRHGLGVVAADLNGDGLTDLFVANDSEENDLWINLGGGRFDEQGLLSGTAVNREGKREAGMGVAVADIDQDLRLDLFLTHYQDETNTLYRNLGQGLFLDATNEFGLAAASRTRLAFGTILRDFNSDGLPDCFVANGHIHDLLAQLGRTTPFAQEAQLFVNRDGRRFQDQSATAGVYFRTPKVGRGAAAADFDGDGRLDIAVLHCNGPAVLLRNESSPPEDNWFRLRLIGVTSARDPIGALITVSTNRRRICLTYEGSSSYLSGNERTPLITMPGGERLESLCVAWPGGAAECWRSSTAHHHVLTLIQGTGESAGDR